MNFGELVELVGGEPVFASALLRAGAAPAGAVQRQLSRWVAAGRLLQLRRGCYVLPPAYRKQEPQPFLVANRLKAASYVSLQSSLAHHGLIPEFVPGRWWHGFLHNSNSFLVKYYLGRVPGVVLTNVRYFVPANPADAPFATTAQSGDGPSGHAGSPGPN